MSRVADGLRKAAEAKAGAGSSVPVESKSPIEKLFPLRRESLDTPWRFEGVEPSSPAAAPEFEELEETAPPVTIEDDSPGPTVVPHAVSRVTGFAAKSVLRTFSDGMRHQIQGTVERVFLPASGTPPRCVAFAAVGADVGSAAVTAATAEMLALQTTGKVCVVDANFASPTVHDCYGMTNEAGLTDALASGCALSELVRVVHTNLYLLSAGGGRVRASIAADNARAQLAHLAKTFKYVLVHGEPIGSAGETASVAPLMDGVVLVVAAEHTRRDLGRSVAEHLRGSGVTIIGAVLVNRRFPIPNFLSRWL
jgi:protein-tyrosine kinase